MVAFGKCTQRVATLFAAGVVLLLPVALSAQATTETTHTPTSRTRVITIDKADVVYVSGDDAVLKLPDGSLRLLEVPSGTSLIVDGKPAMVADLKPGSTLSHVQLHGRTEYEVNTVTQFSGTISAKRGRLLTIRLEDGTSKLYRVPVHATFMINGKETPFENVTQGSKITVTAVKTEGLTAHSSKAAMVANTPSQSGTLVIEK